jgi:hypothetical protein
LTRQSKNRLNRNCRSASCAYLDAHVAPSIVHCRAASDRTNPAAEIGEFRL